MALRRMLLGTVFDAPLDDFCLDFEGGVDGFSEFLANKDAGNNFGIGPDLTINIWFKADHASLGISGETDLTSVGTLIRLTDEGDEDAVDGVNTISIRREGEDMRVVIGDATGIRKDYLWEKVIKPGRWQMFTLVASSQIFGLFDGAESVDPIKTVDLSLTIQNVNRQVTVGRGFPGVGADEHGRFFDGRIHSIAMWDTDIAFVPESGVNSIAQIYNAGDGCNFDLLKNTGAYTDAANLQHWWRLGRTSGNIGEDFGGGSPLIDLVSFTSPPFNVEDLDTTDIVRDCPTARNNAAAQLVSILKSGNTASIASFDRLTTDGRNTARVETGFGNVFTFNMWTKATDLPIGDVFATANEQKERLLEVRGQSDESGVFFALEELDFPSFHAPRFTLFSAGTIEPEVIFKDYRWPSQVPIVGEWVMYTFTWDGTTLRGYFDGVEDVSPTKLVDDSNSRRADEDASFRIGGGDGDGREHPGNYLEASFHDVALSAAEITEIYNSGAGGAFDLSADSGNYTSSANLAHWWRFGHRSDELNEAGTGFPGGAEGKDYGNAATLIDLGEKSNFDRIGVQNVVNDIPNTSIAVAERRHTQSIEFAGLNFPDSERMSNGSDVDLGFGNDWSILLNVRRRGDSQGLTDNGHVLHMVQGAGNNNRMDIVSRGDLADNPMQIRLWDSSGTIHKDFLFFESQFPYDSWWQMLVTFNGERDGSDALMRVYKNGVELTPDSTSVDVLGATMSNTDRQVFIGCEAGLGNAGFSGFIHSIAIYNRDVGGAALELLEGLTGISFLGGDPKSPVTQDLTQVSYASNLIHWWRLGVDSSDLGKDFGIAGDLGEDFPSTPVASVNVGTNNDRIDSGDIDPEAPFLIAQEQSINFPTVGSSDALRNRTGEKFMGVANAWSLGVWYKPVVPIVGTQRLVVIASATADVDRSRIDLYHDSTSNRLRLDWGDQTGSPLEAATWDAFYTGLDGLWTHILAVWDGTTLLLFKNGVDVGAPDTGSATPSLTMADPARGIGVGNLNTAPSTSSIEGNIAQVQLWRADITAGDTNGVPAFLQATPSGIDLNVDSGVYTFSSDLAHWWRPGARPSPKLGRDYVRAPDGTSLFTTPIDIGLPGGSPSFGDMVGLTDDDREVDVPT